MLLEKRILMSAVVLALAGTVTGCSAIQPLLQAVGVGRAASIVQSQLDARQRAKERERLKEEREERTAERNRRGESMAEARRREAARRKSPQEQLREYEEERRRLIKAQEKARAAKLARERPARAKTSLESFKMQWGPVPEEMGMAIAYWFEGDFENGDKYFETAKQKSDRTSEWEAGALASREFYRVPDGPKLGERK